MINNLTGNPEADKVSSYPFFDWLRFILASIVVLDHASAALPQPIDGRLAVDIFFALSGWLIGGILLKTNRQELPRFFFNRSTRIWIPYALAIILLYGVALAKEGPSFFWIKYLILDVTFTHQIFTIFPAALDEMPLDGSGNQFWSISVEEQFYLLAPLVIIFARGGRTLWLWLFIAAAMIFFKSSFAAIAFGVGAAIVEAKTSFSRNAKLRWAALAVAVLALAGMLWTDNDPALSPLFSVATIIAAAKPGPRSQIAQAAGGLSYPLYLNHWIGVFAVNFVSKRYYPVSHDIFVWSEYILNVAIALAFYLAIDRQIQLRRNGWYSAALGWRLGLTAYALVGAGLIAGTAMLFIAS